MEELRAELYQQLADANGLTVKEVEQALALDGDLDIEGFEDETVEAKTPVQTAADATGGAHRRARSSSRRRRGRGITGGRKKSTKKRSRSRGKGLRMRSAVVRRRSRSRGRGLTGGKSLGQKLLNFAIKQGMIATKKYALPAAQKYLSKQRRGSGLTGGRMSPWIQHVRTVHQSNPGLSYGQAMKVASRSW